LWMGEEISGLGEKSSDGIKFWKAPPLSVLSSVSTVLRPG
jgi:hypothetical protein